MRIIRSGQHGSEVRRQEAQQPGSARAHASGLRPVPEEARVPLPPRARLQLGVALLPAGAVEVDGVWWPRSLHLAVEVQPLLSALAAAGQHPRRVVYNLSAWDTAPRATVFDERLIRLDGYRMLSPEVVRLSVAGSSAALVLRVLPPSTDPTVAAAYLLAVRPALKALTTGPGTSVLSALPTA